VQDRLSHSADLILRIQGSTELLVHRIMLSARCAVVLARARCLIRSPASRAFPSNFSFFFLENALFSFYFSITTYQNENKCWVAGDGHQPYPVR